MSYNRRKFLAALQRHGVVVLREGGSHSVIRGTSGKQSSLPRHTELNRITARKIVKQLDLEWNRIEKEI